MKILLLCSGYNGLTRRLYAELLRADHTVSAAIAASDAEIQRQHDALAPDVVVCSDLRRAVPSEVWASTKTFIVHPGIKGDRGVTPLDRAILEGVDEWGVTVQEAAEYLGQGAVWASETFPMRPASKRSIYREEVSEAAVRCVFAALERYQGGDFTPEPVELRTTTSLPDPVRQVHRAIAWEHDSTETIMRKIRASDGSPGVLDMMFGHEVYLFGVTREDAMRGDHPGQLMAKRNGAICLATTDGAVWISQMQARAQQQHGTFKLPATLVLGRKIEGVPEVSAARLPGRGEQTFKEIWYDEYHNVGYLYFEFYNGALSTQQCQRLHAAYRQALRRPTRAIVLMGGRTFWSTGVNHNVIEAAPDPRVEAWHNTLALNELIHDIVTTRSHLTVAGLHGSATGEGIPLALAADYTFIRDGVVLYPSDRALGGYHGSGYWTYVFPRRAGANNATLFHERALPVADEDAKAIGLVTDVIRHTPDDTFHSQMQRFAEDLVGSDRYGELLEQKRATRDRDQHAKPLEAYQADELANCRESLFNGQSPYHAVRSAWVRNVSPQHTPPHVLHPDQRPKG